MGPGLCIGSGDTRAHTPGKCSQRQSRGCPKAASRPRAAQGRPAGTTTAREVAVWNQASLTHTHWPVEEVLGRSEEHDD